jgi:peptidoglycan/LPS O-acetylase OafA/YrhL
MIDPIKIFNGIGIVFLCNSALYLKDADNYFLNNSNFWVLFTCSIISLVIGIILYSLIDEPKRKKHEN